MSRRSSRFGWRVRNEWLSGVARPRGGDVVAEVHDASGVVASGIGPAGAAGAGGVAHRVLGDQGDSPGALLDARAAHLPARVPARGGSGKPRGRRLGGVVARVPSPSLRTSA